MKKCSKFSHVHTETILSFHFKRCQYMAKGACKIITTLYIDTAITFTPDFFYELEFMHRQPNLPLDTGMRLSLQSTRTVYVNNGQSFSLDSAKNLNMPTVTLNFGLDSG